ncbi:MAG: hypothetical protein WCD81_07855 [Candidatus Bathyarchaeia archaeon]
MGEMIETVKHRKKESTLKWFLILIIPILDLYGLWKLAEILSAHEKTIVPKE